MEWRREQVGQTVFPRGKIESGVEEKGSKPDCKPMRQRGEWSGGESEKARL